MEVPKIIVILGPTATGKSSLAVWLAKKYHGQIISADSRQVYKGLNIGSGKITPKEMAGVRHHMLDVVQPWTKSRFTADNFKQLAQQKVNQVLEQGFLPIICGGTGFYIDLLVRGIQLPDAPANPHLRKQLQKYSVKRLLTILKKLDPDRAKKIDINNKVRLIRSIEIAKHLGSVPALMETAPYEALYIGLDAPDIVLRSHMEKRLDQRIKIGMLGEARRLHKAGLSWKRMHDFGLEYRFMAAHLRGKMTLDEMKKLLGLAIWHFAKRQRTWFKRNKKIDWLDISKKDFKNKADMLVKKFTK